MADDNLDQLRRSILAGDIPLDETDDGRSFTLTQRAEPDPYDPLKFRRYDPARKFRPEAEINKLDLPESLGELTTDIIQKKASSTLSPADWMRWLASKIPTIGKAEAEDPTGAEGKGGGAHTPGLVDALLAHTSRPGMPKQNAAIQGKLPAAPQTWGELGTSFVNHLADTPGQMAKALLHGGAGWLDYQQHRGPGDYSPNSILLGPDSAVLPLKLLTKGMVRRGEAASTLEGYKPNTVDSLRGKWDKANNTGFGDPEGLGSDMNAVIGEKYTQDHLAGHDPSMAVPRGVANPIGELGKFARERNNINKQLPGEQHAYPDDMPGADNEGGSSIRDRFRDPLTDNTFPRTPTDRSLFADTGSERLAALVGRQAEEGQGHKVTQQLKRALEQAGVDFQERLGRGDSNTDYLRVPMGKGPNVQFRVPDPKHDHPGNRRMIPGPGGEWIHEPVIDTAEPAFRPKNPDANFNTTNRAGEPYSPFKGSGALERAIDWLSMRRLVREDQAPNFARYRPDEPAPRPSMAEGADFHPDQLKLLAKGGDSKIAALIASKTGKPVDPKLINPFPKPNLRTEPQRVFDTSRKALETPEFFGMKGKQSELLPERRWKRGVPDWVEAQKLLNEPNLKRMQKEIDAGIERGGLGWYNTRQLEEMFQAEFGRKPGAAEFERWTQWMGAGSNRAQVGPNLRISSNLRAREMRGEPPPEISYRAPAGYGHLAQEQHNANAAELMTKGAMDPVARPKPPRFGRNLWGQLNEVAADDHATYASGLKDTKGRPVHVPKDAYGLVTDVYRKLAKRYGSDMPAAPMQSSGWVSQKRLKSPPVPFLEVVNQEAIRSGKRQGVTPEQAVRKMIKGGLLAKGGSKETALLEALKRGQAMDEQPGTGGDRTYRDYALKQGKQDFYQAEPFANPGESAGISQWAKQDRGRLVDYFNGKRDFAQMERPEDTPLSKLNAKAGDSNLQAILAGLDARKVKKAVDATRGVSYGNRQTLMEKQFGVSRQHGEWWKDYLAQQGMKSDAGPRAMIEKAIEKNRQDWKHGKGMTEVTGAPDFRERLAAAVDKHGGNQRKIAEELGVSQATASRWMRAPEGGKITGDNPRPPGLPAAKHGGWAVTKEPDGRAGNGGKQPYWQKDSEFAGQVKDLHSQGLGVNEIAKRTGRNVRTITNAMEGLGLEQNTAHGGDRTSGKETTLSARADDPGFIKAFWASYDKHNPKGGRDGDWASKVAGELGISRQIVYRYADKLPRNAEAGAEQASQRRALDMEERYNQPERHVSQTESGRSNDHWDYVRGKAEEAAQREQETQAKGVDQAMAKRTRDASGKPKPLDNEDGGRSRAEREQGDLEAVQRLIKEKKLKAEGGDEKAAAVAGQSQLDKIRQEARAKKLAERYQETDVTREEQSQANRMANAERNLGRTEQDTARSAKDESDADWEAAKRAAAEHRGKDKELKAEGGDSRLSALYKKRYDLEEKLHPHIMAAKGDSVSDLSPEGLRLHKQLRQVGIDIKAAEAGKNRGGWTKEGLAPATPADGAKAATGSRYLALLGRSRSKDDKRGLIMRAIGGRQKRLDEK